MDWEPPQRREVPKNACGDLPHMFVLVGTLLALFSTPSEKLVTFSDIKHDPFGVWIGEFVRYCTRFQSELAPVLCNINIF
jgi:hypothetical protein